MSCRKSVARLTAAERTAYVNAVLALQADGRYASYVRQHEGAGSHGHQGPAFFPWHREYLLRFERDLQSIDPSVTVPYWDWTTGNVNAAGTESFIWRDDFMGGPGTGPGGVVASGPFAGWNIRRNPFDIFSFPGTGGDIAQLMGLLRYRDFRDVESPHGAAHVWVGGEMGSPPTAVRDPVFWLLHANVDRLWAEWTNDHRGDAGWVQFEPAAGGPTGHNLNDSMWPWNGTTFPFAMQPWQTTPEVRRPSDLLEHRAIDTFYDTIDPECRRVGKGIIGKELIKERAPKELLGKELPDKNLIKDRLPKELVGDKQLIKDRLPKELVGDKQLLKEQGPKELKDIREDPRKQVGREVDLGPDIFIRPDLRPDLAAGALNFEPDVMAQLAEQQRRAAELGDAFG